MLAKTELDPAHDALRRAADYIEEFGWYDGITYKAHTACMLMAIDRCADNIHYLPAVELVVERVGSGLADWNDAHTEQEVIDLLREVAYS